MFRLVLCSHHQADPRHIKGSKYYSCNIGRRSGILQMCYKTYVTYTRKGKGKAVPLQA